MDLAWADAAVEGFPAYTALTGYYMDEMREHVRRENNGEAIWKRVFSWVKE